MAFSGCEDPNAELLQKIDKLQEQLDELKNKDCKCDCNTNLTQLEQLQKQLDELEKKSGNMETELRGFIEELRQEIEKLREQFNESNKNYIEFVNGTFEVRFANQDTFENTFYAIINNQEELISLLKDDSHGISFFGRSTGGGFGRKSVEPFILEAFISLNIIHYSARYFEDLIYYTLFLLMDYDIQFFENKALIIYLTSVYGANVTPYLNNVSVGNNILTLHANAIFFNEIVSGMMPFDRVFEVSKTDIVNVDTIKTNVQYIKMT